MLTTFVSFAPLTLKIRGALKSIPYAASETDVRYTEMFICGASYIKKIREQAAPDTIRTIDSSKVLPAEKLPVCLNTDPRDGKRGHTLLPIDNDIIDTLTARARKAGHVRPRIALLNGVGSALGDTIVGLHCWKLARYLMEAHCGPIDVTTILAPDDKVATLWQNSRLAEQLEYYPFSIADFCEFDGYFDFTLYEALYGCYETPWPDFQLESLGINSDLIPDTFKQLTWTGSIQGSARTLGTHLYRAANPPCVYLHNTTSNIFKNIPYRLLKQIITELSSTYTIVTEDLEVRSAAEEVGASSVLVTCTTPDEMMTVMQNCRWALITDTYPLHVAACSKVPILGVFTVWPSSLISSYQGNVTMIDIDKKARFRGAMERKGWSLEDQQTREDFDSMWEDELPKLKSVVKKFIERYA